MFAKVGEADLTPDSDQDPFPFPTGWQSIALALVLALAAGLSLFDYQSHQVGTSLDDANYVNLALALDQGRPFGYAFPPGEETIPSQFPFFYPLVLTLGHRLGGGQLLSLRFPSLLFTLGAVLLLFWYWPAFSRRSRWWALAATVLFLCIPTSVGLSRMVMSDPLFFMLSVGAIILAEYAARGTGGRAVLILLGVTLVAVFYTRTIGITLVITALVYVSWRQRNRLFAALLWPIAGALFILLVVLGTTSLTTSDLVPSRYLTDITALSREVWRDIQRDQRQAERRAAESDDRGDRPVTDPSHDDRLRPTSLSERLLAGPGRRLGEIRRLLLPIGGGTAEQQWADQLGLPLMPLLLGGLFLGFVAVGTGVALREATTRLALIWAIVYFVAVLPWVFVGLRILYPLQALIAFSFFVGVEAIMIRVTSQTPWRPVAGLVGRVAAGAAAVTLLATAIVATIQMDRPVDHIGDLTRRTAWIKANTAPAAVIMSELPTVDFVHGARHMVRQPLPPASAEALAGHLAQAGADYLLIGPQLRWQARPYSPELSVRTQALLPHLQELTNLGILVVVHEAPADKVAVYAIVRR